MSPTTYGEVLARNIRAARSRSDLSQQDVAARMRALGFDAWLYQTVGNVERGRRRVTAEEVFALSLVLDTTIAALMSADDQDGDIDLPSGLAIGAVSVERLAGRGVNDRAIVWSGNDVGTVYGMRRLPGVDPFDGERLSQPHFTESPDRWHPGPGFPAESNEQKAAARQPVVAAIVTSSKGVLVTRRKDGEPPWGFVTGEIEPGENPEDAAVREVKEETGSEVRCGELIGSRDHPRTHRVIIYMAARPVRGTKVFVGDESELAEVRWVNLAEADELMPDMFAPVRSYLERALSPIRPTS